MMPRRLTLIAASAAAGLFFLAAPARAEGAAPAPYKQSAGPFAVDTATYDWTDAARDRAVPVKIYFPKSGDGPFPVILFSHGVGGTRDGYEYLGRHWASHGYISVHVQHIGSDDATWRGAEHPLEAMRQAVNDPANAVNRPLDIRFAITRLEQLNREDSPLKGRLDLDRIGMAGHSFGAYTTQAVIGEVFVLANGQEVSLPDPRVKAAIAMAPSAPARRQDIDKAFAAVKVPCFYMTGTADETAIGETKAADRRIPFDRTHGADACLVTFTGGDHLIFAGQRLRGNGEKDPRFHELILMSTTAFWDTCLKGDRSAKNWLAGGGFAAALGPDGTFETKLLPENQPPASAPGR